MTNNHVKIAVIGLGYVGLTTALCLASRGSDVVGVDVDSSKVEAINNKNLPIREPGLDRILADSIKGGFRATTKVPRSDIYFMTVGTPSKNDSSIDLNYVEKASEEIGDTIKGCGADNYPLVVVKSTVLPGTTRKTVKPRLERVSKRKVGTEIGLCSNPEFLREGSAVEDTLNPDRIIVGEYDKKSGDILEDLYLKFHEANKMPPLIRTTIENAELTKYASNAFLSMKVSFINEIANICQKIPGADVAVIAKGIGLDKRIGERFLNAGLGWGGSCFPKDLKALIAFSKRIGCKPLIISSTLDVNERQPLASVEMARRALGTLKNKRIAILGLAFKPNTDDIREAVSLRIIDKLLKEGSETVAYDPVATPNVRKIFGDRLIYSTSSLECIKEADCCIVVTEWDEFKRLTCSDFLTNMKNPLVIDGRRVFSLSDFADKRVKFLAVGLGEELEKPLPRFEN